MSELLTAAQMRAIEMAAMDAGVVTGAELMERAGRGVVSAVFEEWPALAQAPRKATVLCGPGNNGGDGFVVARLLKELGWEVGVFLFGARDRLPVDAKLNFKRWSAMGETHDLDAKTWETGPFPGQCDLVVDALFGTGLARPVSLPLAALSPEPDLGECHHVVAVDIPSGLCSDSGRVIGEDAACVHADLTVSFHAPKLGHMLAGGPGFCGSLRVADIGLSHDFDPAHVRKVDPPSPRTLDKAASGHKYSSGHALILSGGSGQTGAARLAARGALRLGAGLVTLGVPGNARLETACQITAIMQTRIDDASDLARRLADPRITALCLGPGLGLERAGELVMAALKAATRPATILDADALTCFASSPDTLFEHLHPNCILTPHDGEFARLFADLHDQLRSSPTKGPAMSRVDAVRRAAKRANALVLLKGADTIIAAPDGRARVHAAHYERKAPWLATAGSGDVLAGMLTGLAARGADLYQAAQSATWLHAEAGRDFGPGLIAEDIPDQLPGTLRNLGL